MTFDRILILGWGLLLVLAVAAFGVVLYRRLNKRPLTTPFKDIRVQFVEAAGWTFRYEQRGRGPHLLLLHGLGANLYCWRHLQPYLTKFFTVTSVDLPGFGQSSNFPNVSYGLDEQVARLNSFLDQLKIESTFVVGNSMGGNIALWLARTSPKRIRGCAVIAPATSRSLLKLPLERLTWLSSPASFLISRRAMKWAHRRTVSRKDLVDQDRVEETFRTYGLNRRAIETFMRATNTIRDSRLPKELKGLKIPILILWGSKDLLVNRGVIDDLEAALTKSESHIHLGGGHHLQEDEPEWTADRLISFFQKA